MSTTISENTVQELLIAKPKPGVDKALLCFCIVNFILNMAVSVIAPFYPPLAHDKAGVSLTVIGYIFSFNPVGAFFFSLIFGKYMSVWGRKRCMIIGLFIHTLVIIAFGLLEYVTYNYALFVSVSCLTRFFQGASRAAYTSISFAYVPMLWPDSIQKKISILESMTGLGLMSGPFIGAGLDKLFGYQFIFYAMGALFLLSIIPTVILVPADQPHEENQKKINVAKVAGSRQIWSLGLLLTMMSAGTTFLNPVFTIHMEKGYNIDKDTSSLFLGWLTISYILFINVVPHICKVVDKKIVLTVGLLASAFGDLIIAPINIFPNKWYMPFIGMPLIGVANALCVLPSIPQYMDYLRDLFKNDPQMRLAISDLSSGLFLSFYSLGTCVGPVLGGTVYDAYLYDDSQEAELHSFQQSSIVMAGIQFVSAVLFVFGGDVIKFNKKQEKVAEDLGQSLQPDIQEDDQKLFLDDAEEQQQNQIATIKSEKEYQEERL